MTREKEFKKIKEIIKENIKDADCGLFFARNIAGDPMINLFVGKFFIINICRCYSYYEVFGCNSKETSELKDYYAKIL